MVLIVRFFLITPNTLSRLSVTFQCHYPLTFIVNAALSPEGLKLADRLLKADPSRGFSGGLISKANLPSDFKSKLQLAQIDARDAEVKAVKDQYNDLINNAPTMEEKSRLIEEQDKATAAVEKRHAGQGARQKRSF